jgi:flavin-dependent dehydrogenase
MRNSIDVQDVVIIGGGPAGSTAATLLSMQGHRVVVLEKEKFPREHVGESLLPYCYSIFQQLGVLDEMAERFVRKPGVRFIDVDGSQHTTWCFGHVIKDASHLSFHVIRAEFDQLLLNNARKHGATVKEQTRVRSVDLDGPEGLVKVDAIGPRGGKQTYRARFLLDASGRDTFLATRMGWKKPHWQFDRAALSTHWIGAKYAGGIQEGLLQIVYLGGEKKGWIWVIPVGTNRISSGVVLNHAYLRQQKAELVKRGVKDWQLELYRQELMSSPFVKEILTDAYIAQPLMFNGDYSYFVERKYGTNFALVGDASTFIDPIFASGVFLSMNSARLVSDAVHQKLASPNGGGATCLDEVYGQINGAYALVDKAIQMFYNPVAINFAQVGSAATLIHQHHQNAMAIGHYLLAGDFFNRHHEYSRLLDLLQDPRLAQEYKELVIDRQAFQSTSCGMQWTEIFPALRPNQQRRAGNGRQK